MISAKGTTFDVLDITHHTLRVLLFIKMCQTAEQIPTVPIQSVYFQLAHSNLLTTLSSLEIYTIFVQ